MGRRMGSSAFAPLLKLQQVLVNISFARTCLSVNVPDQQGSRMNFKGTIRAGVGTDTSGKTSILHGGDLTGDLVSYPGRT
jgi:hypothetical protein